MLLRHKGVNQRDDKHGRGAARSGHKALKGMEAPIQLTAGHVFALVFAVHGDLCKCRIAFAHARTVVIHQAHHHQQNYAVAYHAQGGIIKGQRTTHNDVKDGKNQRIAQDAPAALDGGFAESAAAQIGLVYRLRAFFVVLGVTLHWRFSPLFLHLHKSPARARAVTA